MIQTSVGFGTRTRTEQTDVCSARSTSPERSGENVLAYMVRDGYPVTNLHTLVIPKRHVGSYFELGQAEMNACTALLQVRERISNPETPLSAGSTLGSTTAKQLGRQSPTATFT